MIFCIIQEITANKLKHAATSSIILQCSQNGNTFLKSVDLVILDIGLPDINGIDLCREVKLLAPHLVISSATT